MKIIEGIVNIISWILIFLSPMLLFGLFAAGFYFSSDGLAGKVIALVLLIIGFICGIALAEYARKKHGTLEFLSRPSHSPDLDSIGMEKPKQKETGEKS